MKRNLFLFTIFATGMSSLADPSVIADLKELYKISKERRQESTSLQEYFSRQDTIKARVRPIVHNELSTLADGELTPLTHDLLKYPETISYCRGILRVQFRNYPTDIQVKVFGKVFDTVPGSQRGNIILAFLTDLPREAFAKKEIQQWLVDTINDGIPAGVLYFTLTDESVRAVSKVAATDMKKFSKAQEHSEDNLLSLMSAVFLASREDDDAVKLLDSLLSRLDINSLLDTRYVIPAAAMSGNEQLIKKILNIVETDKRTRFWGYDCIPQYISFAHEAARTCALAIEGFPTVVPYKYDDETKEKVRQWIKNNPTYAIKPDIPRIFLKETSLGRIFPTTWLPEEKK